MKEKDFEGTEKPYIKEKIVRRKPPIAKYILRFFICVFFAVIFGFVAAVTFYVLKPWVNKDEAKETTAALVELPTYTQAPPTTTVEESTLTKETTETESETESTVPIETESVFNREQEKWIRQEITSKVSSLDFSETLSLDDVKREDDLLANVVSNVQRCVVTVKGYNKGENTWSSQSLIFYYVEKTGELLLLADLKTISDAESITAVFPTLTNKEVSAVIKGRDHIYNLAVLSVSTVGFSEKEISSLNITTLGDNYAMNISNTVVLVGSPYGVNYSVAVGRISFIEPECLALDSSFKLFGTDIYLPEGASAFVLNLSGQLIGVLNTSIETGKENGLASFIGTGKISDTLNCMCNGSSASLLGIYGQTVTTALMEAGMPAGVYVSSVQEDGPAYNAGICAGDIITAISQAEITDISKLSKALVGTHLPGETVIITLCRESHGEYKSMTVNVTLGSR